MIESSEKGILCLWTNHVTSKKVSCSYRTIVLYSRIWKVIF